MRQWINLFEQSSTNVATTQVYHGGPAIVGEVKTPFFVTTSFEMGESYAKEKHPTNGVVNVFDLDLGSARVADVDKLDELFETDPTEHHSHLLYQSGVKEKLIELGYDAVFMYDFGYHNDFKEEPTYIVLNPSILKLRF